MGVQPPQSDGTSTPDTIEFGIAALDARLDEADIEFPATSEEIVRAVDDPRIPCDAAGNTLELETALAEVPRDSFESERVLKERLHPVFENYRASSGGLLGQLRAMLPF